MATFRCLRSGNTIEIDQEDDVINLRKHEEYAEVLPFAPVSIAEQSNEKDADANADEETVEVQAPQAQVLTATVKRKRGRPAGKK